MAKPFRLILASVVLAGASMAVHADDIEGVVESVDVEAGRFVVDGIEFDIDSRTEWEDGLRSLADLRPGMRIEVDYDYRDGRRVATEVELDD